MFVIKRRAWLLIKLINSLIKYLYDIFIIIKAKQFLSLLI